MSRSSSDKSNRRPEQGTPSSEAEQRDALRATASASVASGAKRVNSDDREGFRESQIERASENEQPGAGFDRTGAERYRGAGRRLSEFGRAAEEGEQTPEQFMFVMAIEAFKKANAKPYPSWTDVLEVVRLLGYRKTMPSELQLRNCDDWKEKPDTPSNVRPENWDKRAA